MNKPRPVYLNLFQYRFPLTAIVSILHRISGVLLFFSVPVLLWALEHSLSNSTNYYDLHKTLSSLPAKFIIWVILSAFIYHSVAGIRHIVMDCGFGESKEGGKLGSQITLSISILLIVVLAIGLFK